MITEHTSLDLPLTVQDNVKLNFSYLKKREYYLVK